MTQDTRNKIRQLKRVSLSKVDDALRSATEGSGRHGQARQRRAPLQLLRGPFHQPRLFSRVATKQPSRRRPSSSSSTSGASSSG